VGIWRRDAPVPTLLKKRTTYERIAMSATDVEAVAQLNEARDKIYAEVGKVIIGQREIVEQMLTALLAGGHCLLVGVPGLAKTTLVQTLAKTLDLSFGRIQFTPDLMPSDITGTEVLEEDQESGRKAFRFLKGPVFSHMLLADEINRTPPKTQAALLQAMQEHAVTIGGETMALGEPFFVLATQNPIEQEGTYPLPEAQLDRFIFELWIDYPQAEEEEEIARATTGGDREEVNAVLNAEQLVAAQQLVRRVPVADHLVKYAVNLVRASRPSDEKTSSYVKEMVNWGAGPRASQYLVLAAKARAVLDGRHSVSIEDIRAIAPAVLRHRIVVNYHAEAQNINAAALVERLLADAGSA
jgi:MoxR-like ATPase